MLRLAAVLNPIVGTTLAGILVIVALVSGNDAMGTILGAAVLGYVLGLPVSALVARGILGRGPAKA
jgi:hypothetical protein